MKIIKRYSSFYSAMESYVNMSFESFIPQILEYSNLTCYWDGKRSKSFKLNKCSTYLVDYLLVEAYNDL